MNCPRLTPGNCYQPAGYWPVVLQRQVAAVHHDLGASYEFYSGETLLARHEGGTTLLHAGYACDGYSPVIRLRWRGGCRFLRLTPTPRRAGMFPAIWHDFTRQFQDVEGCPWTREQTDHWFYDALLAGGENRHLAGTYYGAVAGLMGDAFIRLTRQPDPKLRIVQTPYAP